jgi:hypothetical protein
MVTNPEHPVQIHYSHTSVPDHVDDLHKQAENPQTPRAGNGEKAVPMQQVVFDRRHVTLLLEALKNPNHPLRQQAEQLMGSFAGVAEKQRESTIGASTGEVKVPEAYVVVPTLAEAAELIGIPPDEIVTIRDIKAKWNLNRSRIQEWKNTGPKGQPRLTPLPVRLKGTGGGQLLFRAGDVESLVANPPKPGRPWK